MKTFKEYRAEVKKKNARPESMETVFGSHSIPKSSRDDMETVFGKHSQPKDDDKKPITESVKLSDETVATHGNSAAKEKSIHAKLAPHDTNISHVEDEAIKDYTDESRPLNSMLHNHSKGHDITSINKVSYRKTIDHLDNVINRQKTTGDMHVFTGLKVSPTSYFKKEAGKVPEKVERSLPAFTSTSSSIKSARGFCENVSHPNDEQTGVTYHSDYGGAKHILKIHVPKGSKAMSVQGSSFAPDEKEVLLARGHVVEIHGTPEHIHNDTYLWHGKLVRHDPHDLNKPVD